VNNQEKREFTMCSI